MRPLPSGQGWTQTNRKCPSTARTEGSGSSRMELEERRHHGWIEINQVGSHVPFAHPEMPGRMTVPHPNRTMNIKTLRSIERQSGLKWT